VVIEAEQQLPVGDDLFEGETWKFFGLSWQMLLTAGAVTGAVAGAAAGVAGEAVVPSGVATATGASGGALVGATAFVVTGKAVAQPSVKEGVDGGGVRSFFRLSAERRPEWCPERERESRQGRWTTKTSPLSFSIARW
jgi:hypothetical protein